MSLPTDPATTEYVTENAGRIRWKSDGFVTPVPDPPLSPSDFIYVPLGPHLWRQSPMGAINEQDTITRRNLRGRQGDTFVRTLVVGGDTTGWTFKGQVRSDVADEALVVKAEFVFTDLGGGRVQMVLTDIDTAGLNGRYVYDIEAHSPVVPVTTLLAGEIYFEPEVTRGTYTPPPTPTPATWPTPATTGVAVGWTPITTRTTELRVDVPGTVIENVRFDGTTLSINANNVIVRNCEFVGSILSTWPLATVATGCLIEDCTFIKGSYQTTDAWAPAVGPAGYTARRVKIDGVPEGFRVGASGEGGTSVLIEDCWVRVVQPDVMVDWHGDGLQGFGAPASTVRNTYFELVGPGTAPLFWPDQGNLALTVEDVICKGGPFRLGVAGSVTGLRVVEGSAAIPADAPCSLMTVWEDNWECTIDSNYQPTDTVPLNCT